MKPGFISSTLVSAALLAACTTTPNMKEVPAVGGSACVDGMTIRFDIKGRLSYVSYSVLSQGTDSEIWEWLSSERSIGYFTWSQKFYMKEVKRDGTKREDEFLTFEHMENQDIYEFSLPECM